MKRMRHTWYYKIIDNGKLVFKKLVMNRSAVNGKPIMMASINKQELNEIKQRERNMNLTIITKAEYLAATNKKEREVND